MPYIIILIELLFLNILLQGQQTTEWKLVKNCDNIKAYVQKVPESKIKKVKVETLLDVTLTELVALIKDAENHNNWTFLNEMAEIIEESNDCNWKYYGLTNTPWPVTNRDLVTSVSLIQNKIDYSVTITSIAIPDFLPQEEDCIRVKHIKAVWTLNPIGNGLVHIVFELEIDPGGNIPIWLVNLAVTKGPLKTLEGLINEINSNKYKGVKLNYIEEFEIK